MTKIEQATALSQLPRIAKTIFIDTGPEAIRLVEYADGRLGIVRNDIPIRNRWDLHAIDKCVAEYQRLTGCLSRREKLKFPVAAGAIASCG